jgi:methionine biosynthesis protein MetW
VDKQEDMVLACISKGLSVFQGDLDEGLKDYPSQSYDYVILNQTLQMLQDPRFILEEMIRVGRKIIVNFPNFGHWQARFQLMFGGRMPQNKQLPIPWYKTPNIHFCTRKDFIDLCGDLNLRIVDEICLNSAGRRLAFGKNAMATQVCMLLESKKA